ncbi:MAG: 4Fe-4S dicluster domain-containing protein [Planctomycetes bacterium]|nr:4Fe-4S dicluster domain-containing protein [Planctomycetota bacterium]
MRTVSLLEFWRPRIPLSTDSVPIETFPAPKKIRLFAAQGEARVGVGDRVKTGQRLAPDLVSPATGTVTKTDPFLGIDGERLTSLSIDVSEKNEMADGLKAITNPAQHSRGELVAALSALGFPTDWDGDIEIAVVSGLDADPVQTINQQVLRDNANRLEEAVALLRALTGLDRVALAVTKPLRSLVEKVSPDAIDIRIVAPLYPNGLPQVLLQKTAPKARKGLVVASEQMFAMTEALRTGTPRQEKLLTLAVPSMGLCKNLRVRIGTPIGDVLQKYEIDISETSKIVLGGAMRGAACTSTDFAVTPVTDSIYVQDGSSVVEYENNPCLNCGKCSAACPMDLQVNLICRYSEFGIFEECRDLHVGACIDCGLCAYVCMARRPLVHYLKLARSEIAKIREAEPEGVAP